MKSTLPLSKIEQEDYKELPATTAFADFETEGLGGKFIYGGIVGMVDNAVTFFASIRDFFDSIFEVENWQKDSEGQEYLLYKKVKYTSVYFHNLEYDGHYILDELIKRKMPFELVNRVNRLMIIKVGKLKFIDSYALLMDSLDNLSKVFSPEYRKKKNNLDVRNFDPENKDDLTYLIYDCLALKHVVIRCRELIHETFGINAKYTTSSTALQAWKTTLTRDIFRLSPDKEEFVRSSYSGGMVYVSEVNIFENISIFDFNSMYPSVMRDNRYPVTGAFWVTKYQGIGFYEVEANSSQAVFLFINGFLNGKKVPRASGKFTAFITDTEYILGQQLGYKFTIIRGLCFGETDFLFREFVNRCERLRLQHGKDSVGTIVKYIQNSLYGKFGTKKTREQISYSPHVMEQRTPHINPVTGDFTGLYIDEIETDEPYMLPHLAAYTTALARCKLVRSIIGAGIENVVYCDTDSLFIRDNAAHRMGNLLGDKYGKIKLEEHLEYVVIVAPKMYFGLKKRAKGFPKRVIEQLELDLFENKTVMIGKQERVQAEFDGMNSCKNYLKYGSSFGKRMHRSIPKLNRELIERIKELRT